LEALTLQKTKEKHVTMKHIFKNLQALVATQHCEKYKETIEFYS